MKRVFCPRCGNRNSIESVYCRDCGEELPELKEKADGELHWKRIGTMSRLSFNLTAAAVFICNFFGIYVMINDETFGGNGTFIGLVFILTAFILLAALFTNVFVIHSWKKTEPRGVEAKGESSPDTDTKELLPEADFSDRVPASVVENTTRKLEEEKIRRK